MNGPESGSSDALSLFCRERACEAATRFGDIAVVTLADPDGDSLTTVASVHRDPERRAWGERVLGERYRRGEMLPGRVWQTERGILLFDVDQGALASITPLQSLSRVVEVGVRSLMIVPLWFGERLIGTLGVARDGPGASYSQHEALGRASR